MDEIAQGWISKIGEMIRSALESRRLFPRRNARIATLDQLLPHNREQMPDSGTYDYSTPYTCTDDEPETRLIREISATLAFQRLSDIRFLGALDYCLIIRPNGAKSNVRFTRAQHSIGVAALAQTYLDLKAHKPHDRLVCIAAAMLHDIGHAPFSHTLEPVFNERFGLNHHKVSEKIIRGEGLLSSGVSKSLFKFGIDPEEVISVLNGEDFKYDGFFSGPINFDTIEGILRSRSYLKMQNLGLTPLKVVEAATLRKGERSKDIVDGFWHCKDEMYNLVIRSRRGVLFDTLFQEAARDIIDLIEPQDFYLTENQIFRKFPIFREATKKSLWNRMARAVLPDEIVFQARHFYVDQRVDFFAKVNSSRYRQRKVPGSLTLEDILPV